MKDHNLKSITTKFIANFLPFLLKHSVLIFLIEVRLSCLLSLENILSLSLCCCQSNFTNHKFISFISPHFNFIEAKHPNCLLRLAV